MRPMPSLRRFAIISLSGIAFIASCTIIASISDRPPKEDKIVSDFRAHRASYERVRTMLSEDKGVTQVAPFGVEWWHSLDWKIPPDGGMPVKRYQEYLALLKDIGAIRVSHEEEPAEVSFAIWGSGFAGETRHVWVCWLEREPPNTA